MTPIPPHPAQPHNGRGLWEHVTSTHTHKPHIRWLRRRRTLSPVHVPSAPPLPTPEHRRRPQNQKGAAHATTGRERQDAKTRDAQRRVSTVSAAATNHKSSQKGGRLDGLLRLHDLGLDDVVDAEHVVLAEHLGVGMGVGGWVC